MKCAFRTQCLAGTLLWSVLLAGCDTTAPIVPVATLHSIQLPARISVALDIRHRSAWTTERREKAQAAARVLEAVLNSAQFAQRLENRRDLLHTEGLSAPDILQLLCAGKTLANLRGNANDATGKAITLALPISPDSSEYAHYDGFTDLGTGIIYTKREWFDQQTQCRLAGLFAHEHMHVAGFKHASFSHPWRRRSVPYAIGDMVIELAEQSMGAKCVVSKN